MNTLANNSAATESGAVSVETSNDNRLTDNVSNKPVSLAKQAPTDNVTDKKQPSIKIGYCEFCSAEFERRVSWKRFCCDDCRIKAWEQKSGKVLKKKVA